MADPDIHIVTERYAAILQTAERLFGEKGYRGVSVEEIARAAGVSRGLVLYHFTSKKILLEHVLKNGMNTLLTMLESSTKSGGSAREKIRAAVESYINMLNSRPYLVRITFFEGVFGEEINDIISRFGEDIVLKFDALIQEGINEGEFRPVNNQIAANMLVAMASGLIIRNTVQRQPLLSIEQMTDEITEWFCNNLSPSI